MMIKLPLFPKCIALVGLVSFIISCAPPRPSSIAPQNEAMSVNKREVETKTVSSWVIKGALAAKNSKKSWTAALNWKQDGANHYQIRLLGPLGSGSIMIEKKGSVVTFRDGPKTITSNNADQLLKQQTGIQLPVRNLYYWVRALPAPGAVQSTQYDRYNHLTHLSQSGYRIDYTKYTSKNGVDLPSKIKLKGHGVLIKLVIKSWSV